MYYCVDCNDLCDDAIYIEHQRYMGHGIYEHTEDYYCVQCALDNDLICCRKNCQGECTRDEWDEEVDELVNKGLASYVD